jgi:hypothetical protein
LQQVRSAHAGRTHCIRAIAGEVVKSRSVHLINFFGGGQVIALKSATALILDRYRQVVEKEIHIGKSLKDEVRKLYQKKS